MKRLLKTLTALALAAALLLGCLTAAAATNVTRVKTTSYGATLRKTPEQTDENKIMLIPADTYLNVYDKSGNWYYVSFNGQYGYVTANERWVEAVAWDTNGDGVEETNAPGSEKLGKSGFTRDAILNRGGAIIETGGTIADGGSNVRSAMDANDYFNIVEVLHSGTAVYVYFRLPSPDKSGSWYYIRCTDGTEGYVYATKVLLNADG